MTGYELSRQWWTFVGNNKDRVKPSHTALYFYIVELWNYLGNKDMFGLPTISAAEMVGVNEKTFRWLYKDLIEFGFLKEVKKSTNQFTSNVVQLIGQENFTEADTEASPNHLPKHLPKQVSHNQTNKLINLETEDGNFLLPLEPTSEKEKKTSVKRKEHFTPPTENECLPIMQQANKDNYLSEPRVKLEAEAFFIYWNEKKWDGVKDAVGRARQWILNIKRREGDKPKIVPIEPQEGVYIPLRSRNK